jgi:hypothetical protein
MKQQAPKQLKIHSDTAWNIAAKWSYVLASDTRSLAGQIDIALEAKDATIAELVEALEAARELYELREDEMESHRFAPHPTDLLVSAALTRAKGQP